MSDIKEDQRDVPELIGALADRFQEHDIEPNQAIAIAVCMLTEALNGPNDATLDQTNAMLARTLNR